MTPENQKRLAPNDLDVRLVEVVDQGDAGQVRRLLERGADPSACGYGGASETISRYILDDGSDPGKVKFSILSIAATRGDEEIVRMLLDAGADIKQGLQTEYQRRDVLECACENMVSVLGGHESIVHMLLEHGIDTRSKALVYAPAHVVEVLLDYPQTAESLQEALCNVHIYSGNEFQNPETCVRIAKRLLELGADVNGMARGETALTQAVSRPLVPLIDFLLEQGANPHLATRKDPMYFAAKFGVADGVKALLRRGVVPTADHFNEAVSDNFVFRNDARLLAVLEGLHQNGIDPRKIPLRDARLQKSTLLKFVLKQDLLQCAKFMFETLGEDLSQRTAGGGPLSSICGPEAKRLLRSLRSEAAIATAIDMGSQPTVTRPKNDLGLL